MLPPRRSSSVEAPPELLQTRAGIAALPADVGERDGVSVTEASLGGRTCFVCSPSSSASSPVGTVVWFHGGGYRMGSPVVNVAIGRRLASACGVRVVLASYSLAPEDPFPAAVHDAVAVLDAVAGDGPVIAAGDSAGGGLAAGVSVARGGSGLAGLVLLSPWLDLTVTAGSYDSNASTDQVFSKQQGIDGAALYLQDHPATDPLASPLLAVDGSWPRTAIVVGSGEVLLDDSLVLAERLAHAGVGVELAVVAGMPHVGPIIEPGTDRAEAVLRRLTEMVSAQLA